MLFLKTQNRKDHWDTFFCISQNKFAIWKQQVVLFFVKSNYFRTNRILSSRFWHDFYFALLWWNINDRPLLDIARLRFERHAHHLDFGKLPSRGVPLSTAGYAHHLEANKPKTTSKLKGFHDA